MYVSFSHFCSMKRIISRYNKLDSSEGALVEYKAEEPKEVDILKDEIRKLQTRQLQLLGKDLSGLSLKELQNLEQQLNESLLSVKERKEQVLMEQLEQSRVQVEELRGLVPSSDRLVPPFLEYHPLERKDSITKSVVISPDVCDFAVEREESDTTLQLGYSFFFLSSQLVSLSSLLDENSHVGKSNCSTKLPLALPVLLVAPTSSTHPPVPFPVGQPQGTFGSWSHPIRIFLPTIGRIKAQSKIQLRSGRFIDIPSTIGPCQQPLTYYFMFPRLPTEISRKRKAPAKMETRSNNSGS
ncbi:Agamous-like MADS-box protein AGL15 [Vitis vinifera]|uniref:Agamous-like MADS-box protein AGL15 n=1 Tax=Vitis vinifera TaxID=29760 RepID=A0A438DZ89_VITVI|nr:Agamous-like MADS-box protein AGL15 [Vitis vinifera]